MRLKWPLQNIVLTIKWTPAQHTILWFITGYKPNNTQQKVLINGVDWDQATIHVNYNQK